MRLRSLVLLVCALGCGRTADSSSPPRDAGADGGAPFGAACDLDSDCATPKCYLGTRHFCTMPCTGATQATDCPTPLSPGTCNMMGFCKPF